MKKKSPRTAPAEDSPSSQIVEAVNDALDRNQEMSEKKDVLEALEDLYKDVEKGFQEQEGRSDRMLEYWDIYNCSLNEHQFYHGNSEIFVPIVLDAIKARKTRFVNQLFPQSGRYIEATTSNGDIPHAEMALIESYIRKAKLRTQVIPALLKNGDVEGQYTVYVSWAETIREVAWKQSHPPTIDGEEAPDGVEEVIDVKTKVIHDGKPQWEVIADSDLLVLPSTADSLQEALNDGGSVTIIRRWSKAKILEMKKKGLIRKEEADILSEKLSTKETPEKADKAKDMVDAAGIRGDGRGKHAQVYETWHMLTVDGERRLYRTYFAGEKAILGCKRNPYWCDRLPIFSAPVEKVQGSFKGKSQVEPVATLQYQANDAANEAMDSAAYALMPIIMTDPEKNPRVGSMILSLAAVWEVSPNDTKFAEMPALWKDGLEIVATARQQIFQTLAVNAAQITQTGAKKKPGQAEIANEQQIDILTTNDAVTIIEEEILTPAVSFMLELDHQFRDKDALVRAYGPLGMQTEIMKIPPIQMDNAYAFRWFGVEQARNAQQVQQQIAAVNVLRGIPPAMYKGYILDFGPVISQLVENTFGPRLAPLTFKSVREEMGIDPKLENQMLLDGFVVPVHQGDDHQKHVMAHQQILGQDLHGTVRMHLRSHMEAMAAAQSQLQQAQQGGPPGQPGAPPGQPGGQGMPGQAPPGPPRIGAQPQPPKGVQQLPGAIHPDQMRDPRMMPR